MNHVRKPRALLVALLGALLVVACDDGESATKADELDGRAFLSQSVTGYTLVPDTQIRLSFDGDVIGAQAGCNSLGASYRVDDGHLVIADGSMTTTDMGCDPARQAQDEWLSHFLQSRPLLELVGDDLTLTTADATLQFLDRVVADPDRPLLGTRWHVDTIIRGDTASSVPDVAAVTLEFNDDGTLTATSEGCNSPRIEVDIEGDTIQFAVVLIDLIGCGAPWADVVELLQTGSASYSITADRLTLDAGSIGLSAVAD